MRYPFVSLAGLVMLTVFAMGFLWSSRDAVPATQVMPVQAEGVLAEVKPNPQMRANVPTYSSGLQTKAFFDWAYDQVGEGEQVDAMSAIVAHHLVVAPQIARVFEALAWKDPKTVVVLSPNHFSRGQGCVQVSRGQWQTPYGVVETDRNVLDSLSGDLPFVHDETAFAQEHGIGVVTPFVARSFPDAKIVPFVLDETCSEQEVEAFGVFLARQFPQTLVIASIDMSHNLPEDVAFFHDAVTQRELQAGGTSMIDLEIDSNATMRTLFTLNKLRGTQHWEQTYRGSSVLMGLATNPLDNTSHILGFFSAGKSEEVKSYASFLQVGDIMLDRGVRKKMNEAGRVSYPWDDLQRFMRGVHVRVANLEGVVSEEPSRYTHNPPFRFVFDPKAVAELHKYVDVVSLANNHTHDAGSKAEAKALEYLKELGLPWFGSWGSPVPRYDRDVNGIPLTWIGYHAFQPQRDLLISTIAQAKKEGRFVIVFPHWGTEYVYDPDVGERDLARLMVRAGADLIIGGHPHVVQGMDVIDGVPVVYSLGNFIFDQSMPYTWRGLTVGGIVTDDTIELHLLPVETQDGQPTPLNEHESQLLLNLIAEHSPETLRERVQAGVLVFPRKK